MTPIRDEGARVTVIGAVINLALGFAKIAVGFLAGSRALVADGAHSVSDLVSDVVVLISMRFSQAAPDPDHPYGHGRIETVGSAVLGLILLGVAAGILWDAIDLLGSGDVPRPGVWALVLAGVSILVKEWLFHYTVRAGRRSGSDLLVANAWHHRSDALTSVATLVGVGGAMLGPTWLDPVGAIVVSIIIAVVGAAVLRSAARGLIDTAAPVGTRQRVHASIESTEGVIAAHDLLTRGFGRGFFVNVHVEVDPSLSVVQAHDIAETVRDRVMAEFADALDVFVHVDPWPAAKYERGRE